MTASANPTATAASAALPPVESTSRPTSAARGSSGHDAAEKSADMTGRAFRRRAGAEHVVADDCSPSSSRPWKERKRTAQAPEANLRGMDRNADTETPLAQLPSPPALRSLRRQAARRTP